MNHPEIHEKNHRDHANHRPHKNEMKTATKDPIRHLLHSPQLPDYVRELEDVLRDEREKRRRFYDEMSETQKVEFINGEIVVQSPVRLRHSQASQNLFALMKAYVARHQSGFVGHEKILIALTRNDYEPDVCFFGPEKANRFEPEQMAFPAPDLVVEVLSPATEAIDRGIKFEDYAAHGVAEYWIVDPEAEMVEQYALDTESERYELVIKVRDGMVESTVIAGFRISARAVFDDAEQLATLQALLA